MKTKILKSILLIGILTTPVIISGEKIIIETKNYLALKEAPEDFGKNYNYVDRDVFSGDMFGDGVIPERKVKLYGDSATIGQGDITAPSSERFQTHANSLVKEAFNYVYEEDQASMAGLTQERTTGHEDYKNFEKLEPEEAPYVFNEETGEGEHTDDSNIENLEVIERTPMEGVVPFGEGTNEFNTYVLSETNNGTESSDSLYFEEYYAEFIGDYVTKTKSLFPSIYRYLENPDLLDELFLSDDSVEGIVPDDGTMTEQSSLTNALVGFDLSGNIFKSTLYLEDYVIGNGNNNIYPNKNTELTYFENLSPEITPDSMNLSLFFAKYEGGGSDHIAWKTVSQMLEANEVDPSNKFLNMSFEQMDVYTVMFTNESTEHPTNHQHMGFVGEEMINNIVPGQFGTPRYNGCASRPQYYGDTQGDYYEQYNPLKQQMNVNFTPTILDFTNLESNFEGVAKESFNDTLLQESTFSDFKVMFEDGLINSEEGINQEFIEFYSTNTDTYYSNMSEDGKAFLGRNRLQSGIYPIEDLRLDNLIITYTDQNGKVLNDSTLLGDIESVNIKIEFDNTSETASLFDSSSVEASTISFDTTNLSTNIVDPIEPEQPEGHLKLIIGILIIVGIIAAVVSTMAMKKKK